MRKRYAVLYICLIIMTCQSVLAGDFTSAFKQRQQEIGDDRLFKVFNEDLSPRELDCMEFLYAYMALPDITDYAGGFHLSNVRSSLQAIDEMPWGNNVPRREFLHFVLPERVNNEHLDDCRQVFYKELKERVQNLSMQDAILEVNHWCHEKVTYRPSDSRTSSPLATVSTGYGRCGEESTFLVAALRSVGIPARQVYTPRWAHTDDNHAWVEAWADGRWWFLGACEPEPVLNLGWFNEPATRTMLVHTKVFGHYDGPEEVVSSTPCYTEINVTANYAPTRPLKVRVTDKTGHPVKNAKVEFKLYNYAEFFTLAYKSTDEEGYATITTGLGDLLVWVSKDGQYAFAKADNRLGKSIELVLNSQPAQTHTALDIIPPTPTPNIPEVSQEARTRNEWRKAKEDSVRNRYELTFPDSQQIRQFSVYQRIPTDIALPLVTGARGNHSNIMYFLREAEDKHLAVELLRSLSDKDLRDVDIKILNDNITAAHEGESVFTLCPRVANEHLTPYKHYLRQRMSHIKNVSQLLAWIADSVRIDGRDNPQQLPMSPISVYHLRKTDLRSLKIFFVCAARSLGIPAKMDPVDEHIECLSAEGWKEVVWSASTRNNNEGHKGVLRLSYPYQSDGFHPQYYKHFTLSRITDGSPLLLNYPEDVADTTFNSTVHETLDLNLPYGTYLLTTGSRRNDGSVLADLQLITIDSDTIMQELTIRRDSKDVQSMGLLDMSCTFIPQNTDDRQSIQEVAGPQYTVVGLVSPNHEPTNHTLRDIRTCFQQLRSTATPLLLLFDSQKELKRFRMEEFTNLEENCIIGVDDQGQVHAAISNATGQNFSARPLFVVIDNQHRIVHLSEGYTIGIGDRIKEIMK